MERGQWLNKQKWFLLAVAFLFLNGYAVYEWQRTRKPAPGPQRAPTKTLAKPTIEPPPGTALSCVGRIELHFKEDMALPENFGKRVDAELLRFSPPVEGRLQWQDAKTLAFRPATRWAKATRYSMTLLPGLKSPAGATLKHPCTFNFDVRPFAVLNVSQVGFDYDRRVKLAIEFTDYLPDENLKAHMSLNAAGNEPGPIKFQITRTVAGRARVPVEMDTHTVTIETEPLRGNELTLRIEPGLAGNSGPLAMVKPFEWNHTVDFTLRLASVRTYSNDGWNYTGIAAEFSAPVKLPEAAEYVKIEPVLPTTLDASSNSLSIRGDFKPASRYVVHFLKGLPAVNGSVLERDVVRTVFFEDLDSEISFKIPGQYLSSQAGMLLPIETMNIKGFTLRAHRVYPNNVVFFATGSGYRYRRSSDSISQTLIPEMKFARKSERNTPLTTTLDLKELLGENARGIIEITASEDDGWESARKVVVISDIGIAVKKSANDLLVWVNSLRTLEPVAQASVKVLSASNQEILRGTTDAQGVLHFQGIQWKNELAPYVVVAEKGAEFTYAVLDEGGRLATQEFDTAGRPYLARGYEAFVFTERGAYRPGETVHLEAIMRGKDVTIPEAAFPLQLTVLRPDGRIHSRNILHMNPFGVARADIPMATYAMTGRYSARVEIPGAKEQLGMASFAVEEFVPPQVRVTISAEEKRFAVPSGTGVPPVKTHGQDAHATEALPFTVKAMHLFGQPAAGNRVEATVSFEPEAFKHSDWPGFVFVDSQKWRKFSPYVVKLGGAVLDKNGEHEYSLSVPSEWRPPSALKATLCATVHETTGRATSGYLTRTVDIYPFYVGIRPPFEEGFAGIDKPYEVQLAVVKPDGSLAEVASLEVAVSRVVWNTALKKDADGYYRYHSERQLVAVQSKTLDNVCGKTSFAFTPPGFGRFLIAVKEPKSGASASHEFYACSSASEWLAWSMEKPDRVELELDKKTYLPGEEARVLVKAPFGGKALVTVESNRVLWSEVLSVEGNTFELRIPVKPEYRPNVYCSVTLIRPVKPGEVSDHSRAFGTAPILLDVEDRRLSVLLDAPQEMRPLQKITMPIEVKDAAGNGVEADVVVAAVDEGICMLTNLKTPDPTAFFEGRRALGVASYDIYSRLMPELEKVAPSESREGGNGPDDRFARAVLDPRRLNPISAARFKPVALWVADITTDAAGKGQVELEVPEFTGQLRLMVVAVERGRFGMAERAMLVRRPLVVRTGLPRFLAPGDSFVASVEVFNNTGADGEAVVSVSCPTPTLPASGEGASPSLARDRDRVLPPLAGGLRGVFIDESSRERALEESMSVNRTLKLADGASGVCRVPLKAGNRPDIGIVCVKVQMGQEVFEESTEIAVRPAAALTSLSGNGSVEAGKSSCIKLPTNWLAGTASAKMVCSSRPSLRLAGGLRYLVQYPYGCLEQTTSSSFPLLYLADLAALVEPEDFNEDKSLSYVQAGVDRVLSMLMGQGEFAAWPGVRYCAGTWTCIYAAHFLVEARKAGYEVPDDLLELTLSHLEDELDSLGRTRSSWYSSEDEKLAHRLARLEQMAYACFVLATAGRAPQAWMTRLMEEGELLTEAQANEKALARLPVQWRFHLAAAFVAAGNVQTARETIKTYILPVEAIERQTGENLASTVRQDAIMLSVWLDVEPAKPIVSMLVQRLEAACSRRGYWATTQDNAFALMALGKYARQFMNARDEYEATISAGGKTLATMSAGDTVRIQFCCCKPGQCKCEPKQSSLIVPFAATAGGLDVSVVGKGRIYYYWFSEGVPADGLVKEAHSFLEVKRRFLDRDGKPLDYAAIRQGDLVMVELKIEADVEADNIVIDELLPAGLEVENARLATSEQHPRRSWQNERNDEYEEYPEQKSGLFEPVNVEIRDDRLLLFGDVPHGTVRYQYLARAVTQGDFVCPPVNAVCMYYPEIFSRGRAARVKVR